VVELTDASQPFVDEATVMYSVDEGDERACERVGDLGPNAFGCGTDQDGTYRITAIVDGREEASQEADVVFSECRLEKQQFELEIGEVCTDVITPSVKVIVTDAADDAPIAEAVVKYRVGSASGGMQNCKTTEISNQYACGDDEAGSLRIAVLKAGYQGVEELVEVSEEHVTCLRKRLK
jgi:hypothetical protein